MRTSLKQNLFDKGDKVCNICFDVEVEASVKIKSMAAAIAQ